MYKCINNIAPNYLCDQFSFINDIHQANTGNANRYDLYLPLPSTSCFKKSLCFDGAKLWNSIPMDICNEPKLF